MTNRAPVQTPLAIDRIESARLNADSVRLALGGRWLDPAGADEEELLVVQVQGRRHRFTASRDAWSGDPERWSASFTLPAWAEPRYDGQAALWLGSAVIPVPPPRGGPQASHVAAAASEPPTVSAPAPAVPSDPLAVPSEPAAVPSEPAAVPSDPAAVSSDPAADAPMSLVAETPRRGPLADLLLKETIAALHGELEQRTADAARVRGALADAQSELEARASRQAALEATHGQLRVELERLTSGVERQRTELDERMAEMERERAELHRQLGELTAARDQRTAEVTALRDRLAAVEVAAQRRAAEAERLREDLAAASVARDAATSEVAGLRIELSRLGTELAATRERVGAEGGDLGEAQRLLADARALAEQLRSGGGPGH